MSDESTLEKQRVENLLAAIDLMELGQVLLRQRISRCLKGATDDEINGEMNRWLMEQPVTFIPRRSGTEARYDRNASTTKESRSDSE